MEMNSEGYWIFGEFRSKVSELNPIGFCGLELSVKRKHNITSSSTSTASSSSLLLPLFSVSEDLGSVESSKNVIKTIIEYIHINKEVFDKIVSNLSRFLYHEAQKSTFAGSFYLSVELNYELSISSQMLFEENKVIKKKDSKYKILTCTEMFICDEYHNMNNETKCAICWDEFEGSYQVMKLPCQHVFHDFCILEWFMDGKTSCPLCRFVIIF